MVGVVKDSKTPQTSPPRTQKQGSIAPSSVSPYPGNRPPPEQADLHEPPFPRTGHCLMESGETRARVARSGYDRMRTPWKREQIYTTRASGGLKGVDHVGVSEKKKKKSLGGGGEEHTSTPEEPRTDANGGAVPNSICRLTTPGFPAAFPAWTKHPGCSTCFFVFHSSLPTTQNLKQEEYGDYLRDSQLLQNFGATLNFAASCFVLPTLFCPET